MTKHFTLFFTAVLLFSTAACNKQADVKAPVCEILPDVGGVYCPKEDIKKLPKYIFLAVMSPTLAPMLQEYGTCTLHIVHTQKTFKMPYKEEQPSQYYICREFLESIVKDSSVTQIPQGQEDNYIKLPLTLNDSYEQTITDNTPVKYIPTDSISGYFVTTPDQMPIWPY